MRSAEFRRRLTDELERQAGATKRFELREGGSPSTSPGCDRNEEQIQAAAPAWAVDLKRLPPLKSASEKFLVAAVMKRVTSVSNRWLTERLQMGCPTSVAPLIHRFNQQGEPDTPVFKLLLSRLTV